VDIINHDKNKDKDLDIIEQLRIKALTLNPKWNNTIYPLEVLGVYNAVLKDPLSWDFSLGNPEAFIDDSIMTWMKKNSESLKNNLRNCLNNDSSVRELFLLRLNYAYLLEEGKDEIVIHRIPKTGLDYDGSSVELMKDEEKLNQLSNSFYSNEELMKSIKTGTDTDVRMKILQSLQNFGYVLNYDLDEVYNKLNNMLKTEIENGLISRIAYLAFEAENNNRKFLE